LDDFWHQLFSDWQTEPGQTRKGLVSEWGGREGVGLEQSGLLVVLLFIDLDDGRAGQVEVGEGGEREDAIDVWEGE
jgi:hypothetical protein